MFHRGNARVAVDIHRQGLRPEYKFLTIRLRLEQQRCYNWASGSELLSYVEGNEDDESLDANLTGLNRAAILEILVQIEALATGFVRFKGKYGNLIPEIETTQDGQRPTTTEKAVGALVDEDVSISIPDFGKPWAKLRRSVSSAQLPQRVKWAIQDKDKYESLINRLKELNDALLNLVDTNVRTAIYQSTRETRLSVLQLHNKINDLDQLIKALLPNHKGMLQHTGIAALHNNQDLHNFTSPTDAKSADVRNQGHVQLDDDMQIASLARFKVVNASIEHGITLDEHLIKELKIAQPQAQIKAAVLSGSHFQLQQDFASPKPRVIRSNATYRLPGTTPKNVWIEWKRYTPADSRLRPNPLIVDRMQKLAAVLCDPTKPSSLRVPICLGYFDDAEAVYRNRDTSDDENDRSPECRFGLVFLKPDYISGSGSSTIVSLQDLLNRSSCPSLTRRVALAQAIANCLLSLHSVNWVHKGLRSANILFASYSRSTDGTVSPDSSSISFSSPYVSGFDYARPAQQGEMTEIPTVRAEESLYRHPDAHGFGPESGTSFKKSFDI